MATKNRFALERKLQLELDHTWCAERVDTRAEPEPQRSRLRRSRTVGGTWEPIQNLTERSRRTVKVGEVQQVVEGHSRPDFNPLFDLVAPVQAQVEGLQPRLSD